jgi:hypothetical protein
LLYRVTNGEANIIENKEYLTIDYLDCHMDNFTKARSEIEKMAKRENKKAILYAVNSQYFYKEIAGYYFYNDAKDGLFFEKILGNFERLNGYVKFLGEKNALEEEVNKFEEAKRKILENDPTVVFHPQFSGKGKNGYRYEYYSTGKESLISCSITEKGYKVSDISDDIEIEGKEIDEVLLMFFDAIRKKRRLNTLYSEPQYHLKKVIYRNHKKQARPLNKALKKFYTNDEIEIYFASNQNGLHLYDYRHDVYLYKAMDVYIALNQESEKYRVTRKKEEVFEMYQQLIFETINKDLVRVKNWFI